MPEALLIAAVSARALAAAADRAGYRPRVVDFFNDLDTTALTAGQLAAADAAKGFASEDLIASLRHLVGQDAPVGIICGAGFEDRPHLLAELARHWRLLGNPAEIVARAKDPDEIAGLCARLSIPHPDIAYESPIDPSQWLIKSIGGSGGIHIVAADDRPLEKGEYYQRRVDGKPVAVQLLADGRSAIVLGLSAQWTMPGTAQTFRYGGAVRPVDIAPTCARGMCDAATRLAQALALRGLNSIDFLVAGDAFHLLDVNPRPGATLDIFADDEGRLLRAHVDACLGALPRRPIVFAGAAANATVYAETDIDVMPELDWPAWCHDRQKPGTRVACEEPICSIVAVADAPARALDRLAEYRADFLRRIAAKTGKMQTT